MDRCEAKPVVVVDVMSCTSGWADGVFVGGWRFPHSIAMLSECELAAETIVSKSVFFHSLNLFIAVLHLLRTSFQCFQVDQDVDVVDLVVFPSHFS